MSTALLIGCGGTRASNIVKGCYDSHEKIYNIGSSTIDTNIFPKAKNFIIDWNKFDLQTAHNLSKKIHNVAFIFFNQNGSSLSVDNFTQDLKTIDIWTLTKKWSQTYWSSCQFPFVLIKAIEQQITNGAKIGWMLSGYIDRSQKNVEQHPDYSGNKYTNYLIMKSFNKRYKCFGINPDFKNDMIKETITNICNGSQSVNGQVFGID